MRRVAVVIGVAVLAACDEARPVPETSGGLGGECSGCHTGPGDPPPFRSATPAAHDAHLIGQVAPALDCSECHTVPATRDDPGHLEDAPTDVVLGPLARRGGAEPTYDGVGCAASYCHGSFPGGNATNFPVWSSPRSASCSTCHGLPPVTGAHVVHVNAAISCPTCHSTFSVARHLNGTKDVPIGIWNASLRTCASQCHEERGWGP